MPEIYEYSIDPTTGIYHFTTAYGVAIKIVIAKDRSWFPYNPEFKDIYAFDLSASPASMKPDCKIRDTIAHLLLERFENTETVIIYYCDDEDGRELKRSQVFERWYARIGKGCIHKHTRHPPVTYHGKAVYTSLLIHEENARYSQIVRVYNAGNNDVANKFDIE